MYEITCPRWHHEALNGFYGLPVVVQVISMNVNLSRRLVHENCEEVEVVGPMSLLCPVLGQFISLGQSCLDFLFVTFDTH